nr:hypothetical protein [uncultured Sphingomonas sp.]
MSAATALALFAFLLGYGIGGLEAHSGSFAAEHPDETRLARLLVWGAMLTIAWASRKPMRELLEAPKRSPLLLGAFAFVPVLLTELAASRFAIAISPYQLCGPNGPPPMPVDNFLPRAIALGSTAWLSLMAWSRHPRQSARPAGGRRAVRRTAAGAVRSAQRRTMAEPARGPVPARAGQRCDADPLGGEL